MGRCEDRKGWAVSWLHTRNRPPVSCDGLTLIELIVAIGIVALLTAVLVPNLMRTRTTTNEAAAMGNLRAIGISLQVFYAQNNGYPPLWQADMFADANPDFGPPIFDVPMMDSFVQGYGYTYAAQPPGCADETCVGCTVTANPERVGNLGTRAFFVNHTGKIRHCAGAGPADASDPLVTDPPVAC